MSPGTSPTVPLASGAEMPVLGLGTWQLRGEEAVSGVRLSETEMEALGQLNEHYSSLAGLQYI